MYMCRCSLYTLLPLLPFHKILNTISYPHPSTQPTHHTQHHHDTQAADVANQGLASLTGKLGEKEHVYETVARRFLERIHAHAPSLASVGEAANAGLEGVTHRAGEVERFVESVISQTAASIRKSLPSPAQGLDSANVAVEQAARQAEEAERIAQVRTAKR